MLIVMTVVTIATPFPDIAMHVVKAKGIGPVGTTDSREHMIVDESKAWVLVEINGSEFHFKTGILDIAEFVQAEWIVTTDVSGPRACPRCVLPLSFSR